MILDTNNLAGSNLPTLIRHLERSGGGGLSRARGVQLLTFCIFSTVEELWDSLSGDLREGVRKLYLDLCKLLDVKDSNSVKNWERVYNCLDSDGFDKKLHCSCMEKNGNKICNMVDKSYWSEYFPDSLRGSVQNRVESEDEWRTVYRNKKDERDLRSIMLWGTGFLIEEWQLMLWMEKLGVITERIERIGWAGWGEGRRIVVRMIKHSYRESFFEELKCICESQNGWRITRGKTFADREKGRAQEKRKLELQCSNRFSTLSELSEENDHLNAEEVKIINEMSEMSYILNDEEERLLQEVEEERITNELMGQSGQLDEEEERAINKFEELNDFFEKLNKLVQLQEEQEFNLSESDQRKAEWRIAYRKGVKGVENCLSIGTWNVSGINSKWNFLENILWQKRLDIVAVCEHWLRGDEKVKLSKFKWVGVCGKRDEDAKRGRGGIGFLIRNSISCFTSVVKPIKESEFEERIMWLKIDCGGKGKNIYICAVYMDVEGSCSEKRDKMLSELSEAKMLLENDGSVWFMGDFNARVGKKDGVSGDTIGVGEEKVRNVNGKCLIEWMLANNLKICNNKDNDCDEGVIQYTRRSRDSESIIDYIIGCREEFENIWDVRIGEEKDEIASDHKLIHGKIRVRKLKHKREKIIEKWNTDKIKDKESVSDELEEHIIQMTSWKNDKVDYKEWCKEFKGVCKRVVGRRKIRCGKRMKNLSKKVENLCKKRNKIKKRACVNKNEKEWEEVTKLNEEIIRTVQEENNESYKVFCEEINEKLSAKEFYSKIKLLGGGKREVVEGIRDNEGNIVNDIGRKKDLWREHYTKLGNNVDNEKFCDINREKVEKELSEACLESIGIDNENLDGLFTFKEVKKCLKKLKNNKAAGKDEITNELLVLCENENGIAMLTKVMNDMWENEEICDEMKIGRIVNIFKGDDQFDRNNFRGVTLLSVVYKF